MGALQANNCCNCADIPKPVNYTKSNANKPTKPDSEKETIEQYSYSSEGSTSTEEEESTPPYLGPVLSLDSKTAELFQNVKLTDTPKARIEVSDMNQNLLKLTQPGSMKEIVSYEKDITMDRINTLQGSINIESEDDIRQKFSQQYSVMRDTDDEESESDSSHLDEDEQKEIEKRKSLIIKPNQNKNRIGIKTNLLQTNESTEWDHNQLHVMEMEMKEQLNHLTPRAVVDNIDEEDSNEDADDEDDEDDEDDDDDDNVPNRHLFRIQSTDKWESDEVVSQREAMKKQMIHLMKNQLTAGNNSPKAVNDDK